MFSSNQQLKISGKIEDLLPFLLFVSYAHLSFFVLCYKHNLAYIYSVVNTYFAIKLY